MANIKFYRNKTNGCEISAEEGSKWDVIYSKNAELEQIPELTPAETETVPEQTTGEPAKVETKPAPAPKAPAPKGK